MGGVVLLLWSGNTAWPRHQKVFWIALLLHSLSYLCVNYFGCYILHNKHYLPTIIVSYHTVCSLIVLFMYSCSMYIVSSVRYMNVSAYSTVCLCAGTLLQKSIKLESHQRVSLNTTYCTMHATLLPIQCCITTLWYRIVTNLDHWTVISFR